MPKLSSPAVLVVLLWSGHALSSEPETISNSLGMTFNRVPAGTFTMGSTTEEPGHEADERRHQVTISEPFYLQTTAVTRGQWLELVDGVPSAFPECGVQCPVDGLRPDWVAWYVNELSESDPKWDYRLPTEAEWEYAARAGTEGPYYTGDCLDGTQANISGREVLPGCDAFPASAGPGPVAQYPANPWGFYDMLGNSWELTADWYAPYPEEPVTDPTGPEEGDHRVIRGGSWHFQAVHARAANRFRAISDIAGFRLVAVPEGTKADR